MIKKWLKRRKAEKQYQALVEELKNDWVTIEQCKETVERKGRDVIAGTYIVQQNGLGQRRVKVVSQMRKDYKFGSQHWHEKQLWAAAGKTIMPSRKELEAIK